MKVKEALCRSVTVEKEASQDCNCCKRKQTAQARPGTGRPRPGQVELSEMYNSQPSPAQPSQAALISPAGREGGAVEYLMSDGTGDWGLWSSIMPSLIHQYTYISNLVILPSLTKTDYVISFQ